jgi:hypothetical protein
MSLKTIRASLASNGYLELEGWSNRGNKQYRSSWASACASALVQIGLNVCLKWEGYRSKYVVNSVNIPVVRDGQLLFPPLFFVPYDGLNVLRIYDAPLNQNHPFSGWLIENATAINEKYPGIFRLLRDKVKLNIKLTTCNNRTERLARSRLLRKQRRSGELGYKQFEFFPVLPSSITISLNSLTEEGS